MSRSFVFAFLPVGSKSTATAHLVRIGHRRTHTAHGEPNNIHFRFHGLNRIREMLMLIDVDSDEAIDVCEQLKDLLRGHRGNIGYIVMRSHETFKPASALGSNWWRTSLALADVRSVFYAIDRATFWTEIDEDRDRLNDPSVEGNEGAIARLATAAENAQTLANS